MGGGGIGHLRDNEGNEVEGVCVCFYHCNTPSSEEWKNFT